MLKTMKRLLILAVLVLTFCSSSSFAQGLKFGARLGLGIPDIVGVWARAELSNTFHIRVLVSGMPLIVFNVISLEADLMLRAGNGFYLGAGGGILVLNSSFASAFGFTDNVTTLGFVDLMFGYNVPISRNAAFYVEARPTVLLNSPLPWFVFVGLGVDFTF
jgi:opacity protein-like surface antigen